MKKYLLKTMTFLVLAVLLVFPPVSAKALDLNGLPSVIGGGHMQDFGWESISYNTVGGRDDSKRLEAIKLNTPGEFSNKYHINYKMYVPRFGGWLPWVSSDVQFDANNTNTYAGTTGQSAEAKGVQLEIRDNNGNLVTDRAVIIYRVKLNNGQWLDWVSTPSNYKNINYDGTWIDGDYYAGSIRSANYITAFQAKILIH